MAKISDSWKCTPEGKKVRFYVIRYQDKSKLNAKGKPIHRQETFDRKKTAEARLLQIQNEMSTGMHVAAGATVTVAVAADMFMKQAEDRVRDGRIGRNRYVSLKAAVDHGIIPFLGGFKLTELTTIHVEDCYRKNLRLAQVAPATAKRRINTLKLIADFAMRRGMVRTNPAREALSELRGIQDGKVRTFSPQDVSRILKSIDARPFTMSSRGHLSFKLYVNIAAFCGLRRGEISALTLPCVDLS